MHASPSTPMHDLFFALGSFCHGSLTGRRPEVPLLELLLGKAHMVFELRDMLGHPERLTTTCLGKTPVMW